MAMEVFSCSIAFTAPSASIVLARCGRMRKTFAGLAVALMVEGVVEWWRGGPQGWGCPGARALRWCVAVALLRAATLTRGPLGWGLQTRALR